MTDLTVRPADAYAALRVIAEGAKAAADVVLEQNVVPAAAATGASTFKTPFGKVYTSTMEAHVEILTSADLRAWLKENLPFENPFGALSIVPEHQEDTFDVHQLRRATKALQEYADGDIEDCVTLAEVVLRAAFPPRTVPERIAEWVIPYLTQRAKIMTWTNPEDKADVRHTVIDSETGEEWPWATAIPEKVTWAGRFDKEKKNETAGLILEQVNQFATLVGVKEIGQ